MSPAVMAAQQDTQATHLLQHCLPNPLADDCTIGGACGVGHGSQSCTWQRGMPLAARSWRRRLASFASEPGAFGGHLATALRETRSNLSMVHIGDSVAGEAAAHASCDLR